MSLRRKASLTIGVAFAGLVVLASIASQLIASRGVLAPVLVVTGAGFGIIALMLQERLILARLADLNETVRHIGQASDLSTRVEIDGTDEIAELGMSINVMLQALEATQRDLLESMEAAEAANRAKTTFLANMSHELRTPLNAVIGFASVLEMKQTLNEEDLKRVERIRVNGEHLLSLIDNILDLSRIESGRFDLTSDAVQIRGLLSGISEPFALQASARELEFTQTVAPDVPATILADQDALTKIVSHLLSNAVKFTETGGVQLTVKRLNDDHGKEKLVFTVSDTGIGIPADAHHAIFQSFFQVDSSSTRQYGGNGLGLTIVEHLCRALNGTVTVESELGQGSTFTVTLPLLRAELPRLSVTARSHRTNDVLRP